MPRTLKRNAVIVLGLATLFWWAFMFAKHDPALRSIIPFGEDPYDAVGSFAVIVGMLLALLALVRAFRPYHRGPASQAQRVYLVRSQEAVVFAVLITIAADAVAMARHSSRWIGAASRGELLLLLSGVTAAALGVHWLVGNAEGRDAATKPWRKIVAAALLATLPLALYPERLVESTGTHLITVVIGAVVLFAPMRVFLTAFVPSRREQGPDVAAQPGPPRWTAWRRWSIVFVLGIAIGAFVFIGEMSDGGAPMPLLRLLFVACVYTGLALAGLLVAYGFLGSPLGLGSRG